jgi:hypothetical protein
MQGYIGKKIDGQKNFTISVSDFFISELRVFCYQNQCFVIRKGKEIFFYL